MNKPIVALLALGLLAAPGITLAADRNAMARSNVNLRSGPDTDYPKVAAVRASQKVEVHGCLADWSWCDVSANSMRGWISADYLDYQHNGQRQRVSRNGATLGISASSFMLGDYWDAHYRDKSWYSQRAQLEQRHPQHAGAHQGQGMQNHGPQNDAHPPGMHDSPPPHGQPMTNPQHAGQPTTPRPAMPERPMQSTNPQVKPIPPTPNPPIDDRPPRPY